MKNVKISAPSHKWMNLPTVSTSQWSRAHDANRTFGVSRRRADKIREALKQKLGIDTQIAMPGRLVDLVFKSSYEKDAAVELIYRRYQFEFDAEHWKSY